MIVVVEISSASRVHAYKEYDAPSVSTAILAAEVELRRYPRFYIVDVWAKGDPIRQSETRGGTVNSHDTMKA
jgi:hypothetical protein